MARAGTSQLIWCNTLKAEIGAPPATSWAKAAGGMDYKRAETVRLTESTEIYLMHIYFIKTKVHS